MNAALHWASERLTHAATRNLRLAPSLPAAELAQKKPAPNGPLVVG